VSIDSSVIGVLGQERPNGEGDAPGGEILDWTQPVVEVFVVSEDQLEAGIRLIC
jgi:hypothetical protein